MEKALGYMLKSLKINKEKGVERKEKRKNVKK